MIQAFFQNPQKSQKMTLCEEELGLRIEVKEVSKKVRMKKVHIPL
jgi:hypothetical protein